jgi:hypothetical protein
MDALPAVPCLDGLAEDVEVLVAIDALVRRQRASGQLGEQRPAISRPCAQVQDAGVRLSVGQSPGTRCQRKLCLTAARAAGS